MIRSVALRAGWSLLVVLGLARCGGCGKSDETPAPPTGLTATQDLVVFDDIDFTWTPPASAITGYEGEGRLGSGPWESLGEQLPPDAVGGTLQLDASVPEQLDLAFRLRSVNGSATSAWSDEVPFRRGVRFPAAFSASAVAGGGVQLQWQNGSAVATGLRIERWVNGAWEPMVTLAPGETRYLDASPEPGDNQYRIIATAGAEESLPAITSCPGYPALPVTDLTATTEVGGVRLRWTDPSQSGVAGFLVYRGAPFFGYPGGPVSPLVPPGTEEWLDPAAPGVYGYQVETRFLDPNVPGVLSLWVLGLANPTGTPPLLASLLDLTGLPAGPSVAARDSQGRLALGLGQSYVIPYGTGEQWLAVLGPGAPPVLDLGTNHGFAAGGVAFDPADHPHALVLRPVSGQPGVIALVHAWHDGAAWQEEEVARRGFDDVFTVRLATGLGGDLAAAWTIGGAAPVAELALRGPAGWSVEDLTALLPPSARLTGLDVDPSGIPTLLVGRSAELTLLRKATAWLVEAVPFTTFGVGGGGALYAVPSGIGAVQYRAIPPPPESAYATCQLVTVERVSGTWGTESIAREDPVCVFDGGPGGRASPVGERRMAWVITDTFLRLHFRDGAQPWTEVTANLQAPSPAGTWSSAEGKFGLLVPTSGGSVELEEP